MWKTHSYVKVLLNSIPICDCFTHYLLIKSQYYDMRFCENSCNILAPVSIVLKWLHLVGKTQHYSMKDFCSWLGVNAWSQRETEVFMLWFARYYTLQTARNTHFIKSEMFIEQKWSFKEKQTFLGHQVTFKPILPSIHIWNQDFNASNIYLNSWHSRIHYIFCIHWWTFLKESYLTNKNQNGILMFEDIYHISTMVFIVHMVWSFNSILSFYDVLLHSFLIEIINRCTEFSVWIY